jgi:hypothetical protein
MTVIDDPKPLTDEEFQGLVVNMLDDSLEHIDRVIREGREDAWRYYYGKVVAKPMDGGCDDVITVVQDTVTSIIPDLLEVFMSSDSVAEFLPSTNNPIEMSVVQSANLGVNAAFWENGGFLATNDAVSEAVISGYGFYKCYVHEEIRTNVETEEIQDPEEAAIRIDQGEKLTPLWDLTDDDEENEDDNYGKYTKTTPFLHKELRIEAVPASNMVWLYSHSFADTDLVGEVTETTLGALRQLGFTVEELRGVDSSSGSGDRVRKEEDARENNRANTTIKERTRPVAWASRRVHYYELYVRLDKDGDGLPEYYKIWLAGGSKKILRVKPVSEHPYIQVPAYRIPHSTYSLGVADKTKMFQEAETRVLRAQVDLVEMLSGPMMIAGSNNGLDEDKLANWKKFKVFFARNPDAVKWLYPPQTSPEVFQMGAELKDRREERVGISKLTTSMKPEEMADITATVGAASISAGQRKIFYLARLIAELAWKELSKKILKNIIKMGELTVTIQGQSIKLNPTNWDPSWKMRVKVGLGTGTRMEKSATLTQLWMVLEKVCTAMGKDNPITDVVKLNNLITDFGLLQPGLNIYRYVKSADESVAAFEKEMNKPPQPSPEEQKAQAEVAIKQQEAQSDQALAVQKQQFDQQATAQKLQAQLQEGMAKLQNDMAIAWAKLQQEMALAVQETKMEYQLEDKSIELSHKADMVEARNIGKSGNSQIRKPN